MGEIKTNIENELVNISARQNINIVGVVEVLSSTEKEIIAKLEKDNIRIYGKNLTITKLSPEEKQLLARGEVFGIEYISKLTKKSFLGKVFK